MADKPWLIKWEAGEVVLHGPDEASVLAALGKYFVNLTNRQRIKIQPHKEQGK